MFDDASLRLSALLLCCGLLAYGAAHDVLGRTIPNRIAAAIFAGGLIEAGFHHTMRPSLLIALTIFCLGVLAYRRGLFGGGDVKLLTATTLLVPPALVPLQLASVAIAGGLLAMLYLAAAPLVPAPALVRPTGRLRRAMRIEMWRIQRRGPLPYGVAIALGTLIMLARH